MAKRIYPAFFMLLIFCHLAYARGLLSREAVNYYNEGVQYQESGDYPAAVSAYRKAMLLNPESKYKKLILNNLGVIYARQGELYKAESLFLDALEIDKEYLNAKLNLGLIYERVEDKLFVIDYWLNVFGIETLKPKEFIVLEPEDFDAIETLYALRGVAQAQKIILNCVGIMYAHSGNLIKAEEKFKAALELDPDYRSAQLNLGLTYDRQKDRAKSTQYWLEISRIDLETLKPEDFITEGEQQEKE